MLTSSILEVVAYAPVGIVVVVVLLGLLRSRKLLDRKIAKCPDEMLKRPIPVNFVL